MKKLYIPGKTWLDLKGFVKEFPHTNVPLIILLLDDVAKPIKVFPNIDVLRTSIGGERGGGFLLGIDTWEYENKINAYKDIVRFVLSPDKPIEFDFEPVAGKPTSLTRNLFGITTIGGFWGHNFAGSRRFGGATVARVAEVIQYRALAEGKDTGFNDWCCRIKTGIAGSFLYQTQMASPEEKEELKKDCENQKCFVRKGVSDYEAFIRTQEDKGIEYIINNGFKRFRARSQPEWIDFKEIYGINDIKQVPRNTISYVVTNNPPPIDPEIDWKNAEFWSKVFASDMGKSILSAVASNMPTSITTRVERWKNPEDPSIKKFETEKEWIEIYNYVFQDFEIIVGEKNNILIRYKRGADSATVRIKKKAAWKKLLPKIIAGLALVPIGLAAGAAVGLVSPTVGGASTSATQGAVASTPVSSIAEGLTSTQILGATGQFAGVGSTLGTEVVAQSSLWSTIVAAAPEVGSAALKLGTQLWSQSQKQKLAEAMKKAGIDPSAINRAMPEGITPEGEPIYQENGQYVKAGMLGGNMLITILGFSGAGLLLSLLFGGKKE